MKLGRYQTPAVDFCLALIAGIFLGRFWGITAFAFLSATLAALCIITTSPMPMRYRPLIAIFIALGLWSIDRVERVFDAPNHISNFAPASRVGITGTVRTPIRFYRDGYRFTLSARNLTNGELHTDVTGLVIVNVYGGQHPPLPGDSVELKGIRIKPVIGSRNIGGFDYELFMKDKGIGVRISVANEKKMRIVQKGAPFNPRRIGERIRRNVKAYTDRSFPEKLAPVAASMTVGVTGGISSDTRRRYAVSGLAHLLAISGLHVGFIGGLFYLIINLVLFYAFLLFRREHTESGFHRKSAAIMADIVIIFFVLSTGMRVSAMRAGIMVGIYFMAILLKREKDVINALALSAMAILILDPAALFSASFILSYLAVLSIVVFIAHADSGDEENPLERLEVKSWLMRVGEIGIGSLKISVAIILTLAPALMYIFHEVHFGGFAANVLALPMAAVGIPATLLGAMLNVLSPALGDIAAWPAILALGGIDAVAAFFSKFNLLSFTGPKPAVWLIALYYAALIAFLNRRSRKKTAYGFCALTLAALVAFYWPYGREATEIHFIDVGQGESTLLMLKDGTNVLIDGGPGWGRGDAGDYIILPALRRLGVRKLDAVIATHGDGDHLGGLATVIKRIRVEKYFDNGQTKNNIALEKVREIVKAKGIPYSVLRAGMTVPAGNSHDLKVIHPDAGFVASQSGDHSINNSSLAMMLEAGGVRVLFAADLEKEAEKYLLARKADLKADILKVAHHGSRTSSTAAFLDVVRPVAAVIHAGRLNRWRHPSREVIRRLKKRGIKILSTQNDGEIVIILKNKKMRVNTFAKKVTVPLPDVSAAQF